MNTNKTVIPKISSAKPFTVPRASTIPVISAANAEGSVALMAPASKGGSAITSYCSAIPAGAKFVGFTIKMWGTDVVQLWNCAGNGSVGTQSTTRYSAPTSLTGGSQYYFVIKTPSATIATNETVNSPAGIACSGPPANFPLVQILNRTD